MSSRESPATTHAELQTGEDRSSSDDLSADGDCFDQAGEAVTPSVTCTPPPQEPAPAEAAGATASDSPHSGAASVRASFMVPWPPSEPRHHARAFRDSLSQRALVLAGFTRPEHSGRLQRHHSTGSGKLCTRPGRRRCPSRRCTRPDRRRAHAVPDCCASSFHSRGPPATAGTPEPRNPV